MNPPRSDTTATTPYTGILGISVARSNPAGAVDAATPPVEAAAAFVAASWVVCHQKGSHRTNNAAPAAAK